MQPISDGMGCISAHDMGSLHICKRHHQCWEAHTGFTAAFAPFQTMSISEKTLHFSTRQCYCILKLLLLLLWQHGFVVEKSGCWTGKACNIDLSPTENIWCIMKQKIWQRGPRAVEQLESNMRKKWDNIPLPKFQQLVSSVARRLGGVAGRREDATQG